MFGTETFFNEVKNMSAALPLVNARCQKVAKSPCVSGKGCFPNRLSQELHSDTMRDRHWALLMAVTKKTFEKENC